MITFPKFEESARSNFKHKFPYVIQGWSGELWLDSKYGAYTVQTAQKVAKRIWPDESASLFRIVKSK